MSRLLAATAAALASLTIVVAPFATASGLNPAEDWRVADLTVNDRAAEWYADSAFRLTWSLTPKLLAASDLVGSISYRLRGAGGQVLRVEQLGAEARSVTVNLPGEPGEPAPHNGEYSVEVWVNGAVPTDKPWLGPGEIEQLRFDNARPGAAIPQLATTWVRGDTEPTVRIAHPVGPEPLARIRGYAVSLHRDTAAPPCAGPDRCSVAETDLDGGVDDDTLALGLLPEGRYVVSAVAVSNSGMRSALAETALVGIDATMPDLALEGAGGGWSDGPVRVIARASDTLSGMRATGPTGARTTIAVDGGVPTVAPGGEVATTVSGSGVHTVLAGARDAPGNVRGGQDGATPVAGIVRIDEAPPAVSFARRGDPADPELIEATVADALSGPGARGSIAVRPLGSGQPFEPLPTKAEGDRLAARWDSDSYPEGAYEFRATGYDLAGNATSSTVRSSGAAMVLLNPVKVRTQLRFGFGGRRLVWQRCVRKGESRRCRREVLESFARRPASRLVPYGRGLQVGGRLLTASGAPLAGATVELVEAFDPGAGIQSRVTSLRTDAEGGFLARLSPGPSRRIEARFGGDRLLTRATSRDLRLGVQTLVRLRASTAGAEIGGAPVVFSGRVGASEATIPVYGRPVQLQFRLPGSPWTEFRTVQTDAHGRFRFPYAFTDDDSRGVRFLFRAYAPAQPGWPYEPAASRPVAVTGR